MKCARPTPLPSKVLAHTTFTVVLPTARILYMCYWEKMHNNRTELYDTMAEWLRRVTRIGGLLSLSITWVSQKIASSIPQTPN